MAASARLLRSSLLVVLSVSTVVGISCGDGGETTAPDPPRASSITLSPTSISFEALGQVHQLTATVRDQNGQPMQGMSISWSSSDQDAASVDPSGLVTAVANGSATVTATSVAL